MIFAQPADSATIAIARAALEAGNLDEAEAVFKRVLDSDPMQSQALEFLVGRAMAREDFSSAINLIERAIAAGATRPELFNLLGQAHVSSGNMTGLQSALERSLALEPRQFTLWLKLGQIHETAGSDLQALIAYFRAVSSAQEQGRWLNDATTGPGMRAQVKHAMQFIDAGRARLFSEALEPLRKAHGSAAVARIERCLAEYLGEQSPSPRHPLQRATFLYIPGLPSSAFYPRELFPWMEELEANAAAIREEALAVLAQDSLLEPFLGEGSDGAASGQLRNDRGKPAWDAFFFYRHGRRYDENCARCPVTAATIDRLPLVRIDEHAPEILFSVLTPGSHILPHTGVTNARLVTHLPLIVPRDCAIRVGDEQREWQEGNGFVFDDTYEHEAWNRSDETRVVLIMDAWNPYLSEVERMAFRELVHAIGAFHQACGAVSNAQQLAALRAQKALSNSG